MTVTPAPHAPPQTTDAQPRRAGLVLASLIAVAAVANLNLSVANVALPDIGAAFDASQTSLDLVAVGYSLGLAASVLYLAWRFVPAHVNETSSPVDNFRGLLSIAMVAALILAINFAPVPGAGTAAIGLGVVAVLAIAAFLWRQRCAAFPLYDLAVARRQTFWVAACAGIIVLGSLMGAMFVGQQYLQNVLGYSTLQAGLANLPAAAVMVLVAPRSAKLVEARGARFTLLLGYAFVLAGFVTMLALWKEGAESWRVGLAFAFVGAGVGLAGTPASRSLTGSVPVSRAGMASATADLQRDLGGAVMQSVLGALLTAGYASAAAGAIAAAPEKVTQSVESALLKSFAGAAAVADQNPRHAEAIIAGARSSFLQGDSWAYLAGIAAVCLGAALVFFCFPRREEETRLLATYHREDLEGEAA